LIDSLPVMSSSSYVDGESSLSPEAAAEHGLVSVQAPGKAKKEDKDKIKLTDLIDKTKASKDERDIWNDELGAHLDVDEHLLAKDEEGQYRHLAIRHEDVGADNEQCFLVDGDSLLNEIVRDPLLDWSHGGQVLHIIYALEQWVKRFSEGGRIFRFVFFHASGSVVWASTPLIQLLRDIAVRHLRERLGQLVDEFDCWWGEEFMKFLDGVDPAFVLVGDGEGSAAGAAPAVDAAADPSASSSSSSSPAVSGDNMDALSRLLSHTQLIPSSSSPPSIVGSHEVSRSLTLYLLSHHFRVVRLTEISFANNVMYGFQVAMVPKYKKLLRSDDAGCWKADERLVDAINKAEQNGAKELDHHPHTKGAPFYRAHAKKQVDAKVLAALKDVAALQTDARLTASAYALIKVLQDSELGKSSVNGLTGIDLCKVLLIHAFLLKHLPLDARSLVWEKAESDCSAYAPLLRAFHQHLMTAVVGGGLTPSAADSTSLLDLFDGRLFAFLLNTLHDSSVTTLGWSSSMEKSIVSVWEAMKSQSGVALPSLVPLNSVTTIAAPNVSDIDMDAKAKEVIAKAQAEIKTVAAAATADAPAGASSASAPTTASAKAEGEDEDLGNWDDSDDEEEVKQPEAKKEEEEDGGESWEDLLDDDEEEEKKAEEDAKKKQHEEDEAKVKDAEAAASSAGALLPIAALDNKFEQNASGELDRLLDANHLLVHTDEADLTPHASAYKTRRGLFLSDGMIIEEKPLQQLTKREQRQQSRQVNYWQQYSKSLVGGRLVLRELVVAPTKEAGNGNEGEDEEEAKGKKGGKGKKADKDKEKEKMKKAGKPGAGGKKKGGELSVKDKIKAEVEEKKRAHEAVKIQAKVNVARTLRTLDARIRKLDSELEQIGEPAAIPALLTLLDWSMEHWQTTKAQGNMDAAVRVFVLLHDIYRRFGKYLTADDFKRVALALVQLGFEEAAQRMIKEFVANSTDPRVSDKTVKLGAKSSNYPATLIGLSYNRFQLEYVGPYMLRNVDSAPDPRVTAFYPDKWQRDLLDVADANQSALIVAPTSAGKTFISYYVMKGVLAANKTIERTKDRGVVVYVAPNKALVNQVSADVYQRYGSVFGIATDDYQDKALTSEVLITVPTVLEKLLLNPEREDYIRKIKWVIFDEVHLISAASEGSIWERCIALIRCPFLALSATVGNPDSFHSWLERLEKLRERKVHLIVHETRWSDLEKTMYVPPHPGHAPHLESDVSKFDLRKVQVPPSQQCGVRVHPCASISPSDFDDENATFPKEVSFSPRDSLSLYDALSKHATTLPDNLKKELQAMSPENYFTELLISKARAMEYEAKLKLMLTGWLRSGLASEVASVMQSLSGDLRDRIARMEQLSVASESCYDNDFIRRHFFSLLLELHARDMLPGIIFSNDPELCVDLVERTLEQLESMENACLERETVSQDAKAKLKQKEAALKALKKRRDKQLTAKAAEEEAREADELDLDIEADTDEYKPDPRFSFTEEHERMEKKELDYWINRALYKTGWKKSHPLIRALARGIGVHSEMMIKQYRDLVETLFRAKHLKVVVATSSLALGINMPARSSVLCGDSKLLTPLQYRQMSGRAGRRGYDNIGHVWFFAVPPRKMFRLLKSPLNSLRGHFPINTTLALRMIDYYSNASDKKGASAAFLSLLKEPFFRDNWSGVHLLSQITYHFRYSLDFLHQKALIDNNGAGYGLSSLATHMQAADPSNYGFVALLESGYLARLCKGFEVDKNKVARQLLSVLAHLFYRVPSPAHTTRDSYITKESANMILLPDLDPEAKEIIEQHNQLTIKAFTNYLRTFSKLQLHRVPVKEEEKATASSASSGSSSSSAPAATVANGRVPEGFYQLPVSGLHFPWAWSGSSVAPKSIVASILSNSDRIDVRSPFVALSGHGDRFRTAHDVADSVRNGIFLDSKLLPVCMEDLDVRGNALKLNAYVVDFYRNQHFYSLKTDNRLTDAFAWGLLKNWSLLLNNITSALTALSPDPERDLLVQSFDHLSRTFDSYFSAIINI